VVLLSVLDRYINTFEHPFLNLLVDHSPEEVGCLLRSGERTDLERRHENQLLALLDMRPVHLADGILDLSLMSLLLRQRHDQQLILPLARLDLLLHEPLLRNHRLHLRRQHVNRVESLLLEPLQPRQLVGEPQHALLKPEHPLIVLESLLLLCSFGLEGDELPFHLLHVGLVGVQKVHLVLLDHLDEAFVVVLQHCLALLVRLKQPVDARLEILPRR